VESCTGDLAALNELLDWRSLLAVVQPDMGLAVPLVVEVSPGYPIPGGRAPAERVHRSAEPTIFSLTAGPPSGMIIMPSDRGTHDYSTHGLH